MLPYIMYHKNTPWKVIRKVAEHNFHFKRGLELKAVEEYMKHINADKVLRDQTHFIFVERIDEVEGIEEWEE